STVCARASRRRPSCCYVAEAILKAFQPQRKFNNSLYVSLLPRLRFELLRYRLSRLIGWPRLLCQDPIEASKFKDIEIIFLMYSAVLIFVESFYTDCDRMSDFKRYYAKWKVK
ncbi:hypothetical protein J6590_061955, partial [Homalodisca vitripennis]